MSQPESLITPKKKSATKGLKICNVANKPILAPDVEDQIHQAVAQFLNTRDWYDWGMKMFRKQGPLILLTGPAGTGKTSTARYLTGLIKRRLAPIEMAAFGSSAPGDNERNIARLFAEAQADHATIFLDEVDGILWDRGLAGGDSMWMIPIINKLMTELADYRDLAIMATNHPERLDDALRSRVIAEIKIERPDFQTRVRLWASKIPKKFPLQLSTVQCEQLAQFDLSGRTIEHAIMAEAQKAIINGRLPEFDSLCNVAKTFQGK